MGTRLRDMIRSIRACKTAAEERSVVAKESAFLRNSFKENDQDYRHRNVAKLMFIHMLGYPTHFGQMECLKLIASPGFPEKRIGYLGLMILLDERQEVLMLVTNSLKNDLNHSNQFIQGLALCALGNICSAEMARDLAPEVEKLLNKSNSYIRKKAALCAIRIIRKVPDLIEQFTYPASNILADKHHGVLLCGIKLAIELCQKNQYALDYFRKQTSTIVRILKSLISSGYTPEYDVGGITDPFLQVRILRLLRLVGKGDAEASDIMSDILAQVATNTESSKNSGNSILYECVSTIMAIESIGGLRILAINILGRFLSNKDNNIRYVALNTLVKIVSIDTQAVQRHRKIIVECVKDSDISIRRRALELLSGLVNETNVKNLINELLNYLKICDNEFKPDLTSKLCYLIQKFSPTKTWQIDTLIKVMIQAGEFVKSDDVVHPLIVLISNDPQIYGYSARAFFKAFKDWRGQDSLTEIISWVIGEYGDLLLNPSDYIDGEERISVDENAILHIFELILKDVRVSVDCKALSLISLLKLSSRLPSSKEKIKSMILHYKGFVALEIQQRAIEFSSILSKHENIKSVLVERMPALDEASYKSKRADINAPLDHSKSSSSLQSDSVSDNKTNGNIAPSISKTQPSLLKDLLDLSMDDAPSPSPSVSADQNLLDLLGASFSNPPNPPATSPAPQKQAVGADSLLDLLSLGDSSTASSPSIPPLSSSDPPLFTDFPSAAAISTTTPLDASFPSLTPLSSSSATNISSDPFSLLTQSFPATTPPPASLSPSNQPAFPSLFPSAPSPSPLAASPAEPPLFSLTTSPASPSPSPSPSPTLPVSSTDPFTDLGFGSFTESPAPSLPSIVAFEKDGLKVVFDFSKSKDDTKKTVIKASYFNSSIFDLQNFVLQVSVPKYLQLSLLPATSSTVPGNSNGSVHQELHVINNLQGQKALVMKLRIVYKLNGQDVVHQTQVNNFPSGL